MESSELHPVGGSNLSVLVDARDARLRAQEELRARLETNTATCHMTASGSEARPSGRLRAA
jgi:hypothetical protein